MRLSRRISLVFPFVVLAAGQLFPALAQQEPSAQQPASSSVSSPPSSAPKSSPNKKSSTGESSSNTTPAPPPQQKPPALVDPAGPAISLQTSETLFDVAVALNACGYDDGLDRSDPIRLHVRGQVNQALLASEKARDDRDKLCSYIAQHRVAGANRDLAQYISLALYVTPPPDLALSVDLPDMPPEATQVSEILPLLRDFVQDIDLHGIWVTNRRSYDELVNALHDPLTKMIVSTNAYLKTPASTYDGRRFLVVLEPMFSSSAVNARIYGTDYVVVASPLNATVRMADVRHTYLHYEIEPLLYARATAMDRLLPFLKTVREAPLDFTYRSDIVSLVIECLIKSIEARTMDTGVPVYKVPDSIRRNDMERVERERNAYQQKIDTIREQAVKQSMAEGFVLTQYFYDRLIAFEHAPESLKESIGEMVYGMDVNAEVHKVRDIEFAKQGEEDVVRRVPPQLRGLDLAEMKLRSGDLAGAESLARKALADRSPDTAWADFILARIAAFSGHAEDAVKGFQETLRLSQDPRMLAWSHIYLGRIHDLSDEREEAVAEYKAALTVRDGQQDTKRAAEEGLKKPYSIPNQSNRQQGDANQGQQPPAKP
jgi:hypothetical protein